MEKNTIIICQDDYTRPFAELDEYFSNFVLQIANWFLDTDTITFNIKSNELNRSPQKSAIVLTTQT